MRHNGDMSFPLGSLSGQSAASASASASADHTGQTATRSAILSLWPFSGSRRGVSLVLGAALWLLCALALWTHHAGDPGFSTSGAHGPLHNRVGVVGSYASDLGYFLLGYSLWWALLVAARQWLAALAARLRADSGADSGAESGTDPWGASLEGAPSPVATGSASAHRWTVWVGLALLLAASAALEWTRLYSLEPRLPGPAGGVLGYTLGSLSMHWLGFAGSGVFWIACLVVALPLALQFSWMSLAEAIGERIDGLRERRQERLEIEEDQRLGEQALREREAVVDTQLQTELAHVPILIEEPVLEVPKSERVAKERQKPLFVELSENKLPQVDLLDAVGGRQETVSAESLELTSTSRLSRS